MTTTNSLGLNKSPRETKVCVAMSGGVDSSAAAYLLQKEGYEVFGLTMDLLAAPYRPETVSFQDAAGVAEQLGIIHEFLDLRAEFRQQVVDYFRDEYICGRTPSPCIMCNRQIKLGLLAEAAKARGADVLVTGHYAEIRLTDRGVELHRGQDPQRDQSYFLFAAEKKYLQMLRCPLAKFSKAETRALAAEAGLSVAQKSDSQDICFVHDGKYAELISRLKPPYQAVPGEIVSVDGEVLGQHRGIIHYTIGQRRGLGIGGRKGHPEREIWYVTALEPRTNRVIVGRESDLQSRKVIVKNINWLAEERKDKMQLAVKLRSKSPIAAAEVEFDGDEAVVWLKEAFAAAAPGQGCCFYDGTRVLGGGFIR